MDDRPKPLNDKGIVQLFDKMYEDLWPEDGLAYLDNDYNPNEVGISNVVSKNNYWKNLLTFL